MDDAKEFVFLFAQRGFDFFNCKDFTQRTDDAVNLSTYPCGDICKSFTKISMNCDQHIISRLDEVDKRSLHARGARARESKGPFVVRLKNSAEQILFFCV